MQEVEVPLWVVAAVVGFDRPIPPNLNGRERMSRIWSSLSMASRRAGRKVPDIVSFTG